jgi:heat-inducible transcriptional repressor
MVSELTARQKELLFALIEEHIATGQPVASGVLLDKGGYDISSATIRNEFARLEAIGFLEKPHTSSGRVPTTAALRLYAEDIAEHAVLGENEKSLISRALGGIRTGIEDALRRASEYLSDETKMVSIVVSPPESHGVIELVDLVPVAGGGFVIILVTRDGHVENALINIEGDPRNLNIDFLKHLLNIGMRGHTPEDINGEILDHIFQRALSGNIYHESIRKPIVDFLERLRRSHGEKVFSHGLRQLMENPEFVESKKLRAFLRARSEEAFVRNILMDLTGDMSRVRVLIGRDNVHEELEDLAIVFTNFSLASESESGRIGVIGPTRMPYARIIPLVGFIADYLTRKFGERIVLK